MHAHPIGDDERTVQTLCISLKDKLLFPSFADLYSEVWCRGGNKGLVNIIHARPDFSALTFLLDSVPLLQT